MSLGVRNVDSDSQTDSESVSQWKRESQEGDQTSVERNGGAKAKDEGRMEKREKKGGGVCGWVGGMV